MLSPSSKCDSEETTTVAQSDLLHSSSSSRSESQQRLSLLLSLPNHREEASRKMRSKKESGKSPIRKSPRFTPVNGDFDNVCSVPVNGKFGSRKRKISSSDIDKKKSLENSVGLSFKDIAAIAKSLEMEIVAECGDKNDNGEGRTQVSAKKEVESDALSPTIKNSKQTRRSPRFTKGMGNEREEDIEKPVGSRNTSVRSLRLSGTVENGHVETLSTIENCGLALYGGKKVRGTEKMVQISDNGSCCEGVKKFEGDGLDLSKEKLLNLTSGCIKSIVNGSRDKTLRNVRSSKLNTSDFHSGSLDVSENGTSNGLTMKTVLVEQESVEFSLQGKTSDYGAADKGTTEEIHANSTMVYLSVSDEKPAKEIKISAKYSSVKNSNGDNLEQAASGSTLSSEENGPTSLDQNSPTQSTKGKGERVTRTAVPDKHEQSICFFIGEPIPCEEAQERWRWRYDLKERKSKSRGQQLEDDEDKIISNVECHYSHAKVDNQTFSLEDFAYIKGEEEEKYVGKIVEFF